MQPQKPDKITFVNTTVIFLWNGLSNFSSPYFAVKQCTIQCNFDVYIGTEMVAYWDLIRNINDILQMCVSDFTDKLAIDMNVSNSVGII